MPDKHEVGGSSPLGPTNQSLKSFEMQNSKCKMQNEGSKMQNAKCRIKYANEKLHYEVSLVTFLYKESNTNVH